MIFSPQKGQKVMFEYSGVPVIEWIIIDQPDLLGPLNGCEIFQTIHLRAKAQQSGPWSIKR